MPCEQCHLAMRYHHDVIHPVNIHLSTGNLIAIFKEQIKCAMILLWPSQESKRELLDLEIKHVKLTKTLIAYQVHPVTLLTPFSNIEEFHNAHTHPSQGMAHYSSMEEVAFKLYLTNLYTNPAFSLQRQPTLPSIAPKENVIVKKGHFWGTYVKINLP